ncbi:hypothetical protein LTR28_002265 [Elasticomyces elasticus]|nr:hypothetical protein LTR28_002265 [Elasticomyces elasticus]
MLAASDPTPYGDDASSEIEDVPIQSSEANIEEAVATSTDHQETSSPDHHRTKSEVQWKRLIKSDRTRTRQVKLEKPFKASMKPKRTIGLKAISRLSIRTKLPLDVKHTAKIILKSTKVLKAMLKLTVMHYLMLQLKGMAVQ